MVGKILNSKAKTITFAAFLIGGSTLISGLLGLIKMRLLAGRFDVGFTLDSYFAAFRIPDLISATLIAGGIVVSFLPLLSQQFQKDKNKAWKLVNNVVNVSFVFLAIACVIIWIFVPQLVNIIAPGFPEAQKDLTVALTRIMFISPLIFALSGIFSSILHHFDRFLAYSLAPILYNIGIIFGILFLSGLFEENKMIYGAAWGVVIGALLHLVIQIPSAVKSGYRWQFVFNLRDLGLIKMFKLMVPRMISQASVQTNLIVITAIASVLTAGSVAVFNFAYNLFFLPVSIVGVSLAIAAFPSFSRSLANGKNKEFLDNFSSTFRQIFFIIFPLAVMAIILRAQIVRVILGTGEFGWTETRLTAAVLGVFALSMIFAGLIPLMVRAFFSFQDTKTPAIVSVVSVFLNIALSFFFVFLMNKGLFLHSLISSVLKLDNIEDIRVVGLALAISITMIFQFVILLFLLIKKMESFPLREIGFSIAKVILAGTAMAVVAYFALRVALFFVQLTTFGAVLFQAGFSFIFAIAVYLIILYLLDSRELKTFWLFILNRIR